MRWLQSKQGESEHRPARDRIRWAVLIGLLLIVSLAPPIRQPVYAQEVGHFQPVDCARFDLPPALAQARTAECGYVTVPEVYGSQGSQDGRTIRLGVVILHSRSPNPAPYPLFMMQGGPGGSTIHDFPLFLMLNPVLLQSNRDYVLFDQRGTLYSQPRLDCPEEMDLTLQTLDDDLSDEEALSLALKAAEQCRTRLEKAGVRLSAYDSLENAGDVDAIRRALGYEKIDLYGVSYGTLLALQVMRLYPDGLRAVVLDSVVAPQINDMLDGLQPQVRAINMIFEACAADADCRQAYPELERVFYEQVERLNETPASVQLTDTDYGKTYTALMDGDTLLNAAVLMMFSTESIPLIPRMIYDARAGNYSIAERILASWIFDRSFSTGMFYSVKCAEEANYTLDQVNDEGLPEAFVSISKYSNESFLKTCQIWNVEDESAEAGLVVQSDIPTLILSGAFDPTTPPSYAEEVAKTLPNSYSFLFPSGGHGELFSFSCAQEIMFAFLDDPTSRPDGSCIPNEPPKFVTARSVVRLPAAMRFLTLDGTAAVELALFGLALGFLLTAALAYPLAWTYRLLRGRPAPTAYPAEVTARPRTARAWKLAPWLAVLLGVLLGIFAVVLAVILVTMAVNNDVRFLVGVPGSARPLFLLPPLAALLVVAMLVLSLLAWVRGWGTAWGRVYYTLLALAGVVCVALLAYWGMLAALVL